MADEMDTCEYIWNHELAMRRLLSLLRNGQSYCTDAECIDLPSGTRSDAASDGNQFLMTFVVLVLAVLLFMMRPVAFGRRSAENASDKPPQPPANGGGPPAPAIH